MDTNILLYEIPEYNPGSISSSPPLPPACELFKSFLPLSPSDTEIKISALPNPFNSTVNIEVSNISSINNITIDIFDINGKHIRDINNLHASGSSVEAKWNGKNNSGQTVPAGIYMYKIQSGEEVTKGRLLFVK